MKKYTALLLLTIFAGHVPGFAQTGTENTKIDLMLIRGEYKRVIDTCQLILSTDSLNSAIYYKMGLAYQNLLRDDNSFNCFLRASEIEPDNNLYSYLLAKGYYSKGKNRQAKPILEKLCSVDSLNWSYAFYLTSILMQEKNYDESLRIYQRFYEKDSSDYVILDKIGFALLRMGFYPTAIDYYNRSLAQNKENVGSLKNLSFLYASTQRSDTALQLLTFGMEIDPTDMDLYVRRAALNFMLNRSKRALDDYLKILAAGDSAVLYIKRAGIGYSNNLQPKEAIKYLQLAYKIDSADYEVSSYLARNYQKLKDYKKSAYYYKHIINTLDPVLTQISLNYVLLAEILRYNGQYDEAIAAYLKSQKLKPDVNIYMIVGNVYDEKKGDIPKAIYYYQMFLDNLKDAREPFTAAYVESIRKRLEFLKTKSTLTK